MNKIKIYTSDEFICVERDRQKWIDERTEEFEEDTDAFADWMADKVDPTELFYCSSRNEYQMAKLEIRKRWHEKCVKDAEEDFGYEWEEHTIDLDGGNI